MSSSRPRPARRWVAATAAAVLLPGLAAAVVPMAGPAVADPDTADAPALPVLERTADEEPVVVKVEVADRDELDRLVGTGVDLDHGVEQHGDHLDVKAVVTPGEIATLQELGFTVGEVVWTQDDARRAVTERTATIAQARQDNRRMAQRATNPDVSDVRIIRADYYTAFGVGFLSVEAKWANGQTETTALTVERDSGPGTAMGSGGTQNITRFVDAGVYLYHRGAAAVATAGDPAVAVRPDKVRITSASGDVAEATVRDWLPTPEDDDPFKGPGYQQDFIGSYHDPTQLYDRIKMLAQQYPSMAELVELPNQTNGYRRLSQALLDPPGNRLVVRTTSGPAGEFTYVPRTGTVGAVPAGGFPATSTQLADVVAGPNEAFPNATPAMGCGPISGFPAGAIAVVTRGECTFQDKATNAQAAGASAVVVVNNLGGAATGPGNIAATVTIPVVGVSQADGATLRALPAGVTGRLVPATAVSNDQRVGLDSKAWGHEGGDDLVVQVLDPGAANADLSVSVAGRTIQVVSASDATGARTSTAAQVVAAINAHPRASTLVTAYTYRGNAGGGVVQPTRLIQLDDNLNAPDYVSHEPQTVYALRIGTSPEGTKPGVFAYAQEHAREWVPPLVTIEAAERLLRNYGTHAPTKDLVDNLEVWIMPSVNPDGGHYSFYDFASQRRNMKRYCEPTGNFDVTARNSWGVDVNRNYDEYSLFDGYDGASASCTSDTFAGPGELSESESKNVDWVAAKPNMKFSMNMHSSGNYFMWSPGAYKLPGRVSAPRPTLEEENYFWQASSRILTAIKRHRGMSVTPARTGVTSDVLYSAAGNSGDMNWYKHHLYAWNFEVGTTFQPPFESTTGPNGASAHAETMEYANGLVELMRVARDLDSDVVAPTSTVTVTESSTAGKVNVAFSADESAEIRYTLDGTRPSETNPATKVYAPRGVREDGELLTVDAGAKIYWYATDTAGNVEGGYNPADDADRRYRKWIARVGYEAAPAPSTVALAVAPTSVVAGNGTVEATVTVTSDNDFGLTPSGEVTVTAGTGANAVSATAPLDATGKATVDLGPFASTGSKSITATYAGDDVAATATSSASTVAVTAAPSTVDLTVTPAQVAVGTGKVRVRVAVTAPNQVGHQPSGTVVIGNAKTYVVARLGADGTAVADLGPFDTAGVTSIAAAYTGDSLAAPSSSAGRQVRVAKAASSVAVVRQSPTIVRTKGTAAQTRAVLRIRVRTPGTPVSGRVTVVRAGSVVARGTVGRDGIVELRLPRFPQPGTKTVRVVFAGNANATAASVVQKITVRR
ncbi:M14 family zinc carboxypeptidase [Nocardioides sp. C4-1]|uniref:M14 family zinc carboxypeptidase n=1 Tax=Nocardioides sp. C4-1 TaxID=3151851 RepID=UPI003263D278